MSLIDAWLNWKEWFASLSPEFVFLLALPFLVVLAAGLKYWLTRPPAGRVSGRTGPRPTSLT